MKENVSSAALVNRLLLGLLMFIPGLLSLFVIGPSKVVGMLTGLGFIAPTFFAWVLIIFEIGCGIAILANWNLHYTTVPPIAIMLVAGFTTTINWSNLGNSSWPFFLLHMVAASNYWMLSMHSRK